MTLQDNKDHALQKAEKMSLVHNQIEVLEEKVLDVETDSGDNRTVHYVDVVIRRDGNPRTNIRSHMDFNHLSHIETVEENNIKMCFHFDVETGGEL